MESCFYLLISLLKCRRYLSVPCLKMIYFYRVIYFQVQRRWEFDIYALERVARDSCWSQLPLVQWLITGGLQGSPGSGICISHPWPPICIYGPWNQICIYRPWLPTCIYRPWPPMCVDRHWPKIIHLLALVPKVYLPSQAPAIVSGLCLPFQVKILLLPKLLVLLLLMITTKNAFVAAKPALNDP